MIDDLQQQSAELKEQIRSAANPTAAWQKNLHEQVYIQRQMDAAKKIRQGHSTHLNNTQDKTSASTHYKQILVLSSQFIVSQDPPQQEQLKQQWVNVQQVLAQQHKQQSVNAQHTLIQQIQPEIQKAAEVEQESAVKAEEVKVYQLENSHIKSYFIRHSAAKRVASPHCLTSNIGTSQGKITNDTQINQAYWRRICYSYSAVALSYWLYAYHYATDGKLHDVTHEVLPPLSVLTLPEDTLAQYWQFGFQRVFMDISGITRVPVFLWVDLFSSYAPIWIHYMMI